MNKRAILNTHPLSAIAVKNWRSQTPSKPGKLNPESFMKNISCLTLLLAALSLATPPGLHSQVFTNLHDFSAGTGSFGLGTLVYNTDGARPLGGLVIANGALYGTTAWGGTIGEGVVFKLDFNGGDFSVIHTFDPNNYLDGFNPNAGLVLADGILYGTTAGKTASGQGFIFTVGTDGSTYTPLFDFTYADAYYIFPAGLTISSNVIYGISTYGGSTEYYGSVFRVSTDQTGLTNLYSFAPAAGINYTNKDGANPRSRMVLVGDTLFGTAQLGGTKGCGTLFSVKTDGTSFKVLHTFLGGSTDGTLPSNYLVVSGNTLYGTTQNGGTGYGTVFKMNTDGSGYKVIYYFQGSGDGGDPYGGVIVSGNTLYGMAGIGGTGGSSNGSFFSLNPDGTGFKTLVYVPGGPGAPGGNFYNDLIISGNTLYGTARFGGAGTNGFVFSITLPTETTPPTLSITNVTAGMSVSNAAFTVKGTAKDNVAVASVLVALNAGAWTAASLSNGGSNWTEQVTLIPGTNSVAAYAMDTSGNLSPTNTLKFVYVVSATLTVRTNGNGTISPNYDGATLPIGASYSMTATAKAGCVFKNWTDGLGNVLTNGTTLKFVMAPNLTFVANIVDVTLPGLTITAPANLQKMTNALAYVKGTARDNWQVAEVWYQLNNGVWSLPTTTNGWTNWSVTLSLVQGTNEVNAYAVDLGGNRSTTASVSMVSSNTFKLQLVFTNAVPLETNGLFFSLQLSTGLNGHIQVSSNLTSWTTLTNFVGTNSTLHFRDPAASNSSHRYYRAVIP
jgi:uncharacterized repeat protein (TIGR03803 family)